MTDSSRRDFLRMLAAGGAMATFGAGVPPLFAGTAGAAPLLGGTAFDRRRKDFLEYCSAATARYGYGGFHQQIANLELGRPVEMRPFHEAIEATQKRRDCSDFCISGFLRILYRYQPPILSEGLKAELETSVLGFKYWWDEPGTDDRSYDTENHQILYHSCQLLAGQMFPDKVFTNSGRNGREQMAFAQPMIRRWLGWRVRFGFSEWLSNCYCEEELTALTNLRDFAEAPDIRAQAEMLIDVVLLEIALHSYRGTFGSTHGRTYAGQIKGGKHEGSTEISHLIFGAGFLNKPENMAAVALATSSYRCSEAILAVAADTERTVLCRERQSLNVEDAGRFGLSTTSADDLLLFRGVQDFTNYLTLDVAEAMTQKYHLRNPGRYAQWRGIYARQIAASGRVTAPWLCPNALGEVHIQTLRTADYLLSCAQDYRAGIAGYQQHIWQATLGVEAVVFTNHPGSEDEGIKSRPNFWAGNGLKPRAVQHQNVLICLHRVPADNKYPYSHAYFPRSAFDEVVQKGPWTFARKADGYLALYSQAPTTWRAFNATTDNELRADACDNVWMCEMGSKAASGSFGAFIDAIGRAQVRCENSGVSYVSPSVGSVAFAWGEPLHVDGKVVAVDDYPRFDNPYCQVPFQGRQVKVQAGAHTLNLDFAANRRQAV